jgi:hypothetical protein
MEIFTLEFFAGAAVGALVPTLIFIERLKAKNNDFESYKFHTESILNMQDKLLNETIEDNFRGLFDEK